MTSDQTPSLREPRSRSIRILLADDHAVVRDGLRLLLETEADMVVVGEAADGRQAVRRVGELRPDVAVLDIAMPELNGIEATRQIIERYPATRAVILSMHAEAEHIHRAFEAGARGYVLKESAGREVVDAVRFAHVDRRYLSGKIADTMVDEYVVLRRGGLPARSPLDSLTAREREVLQLVVEGKSSKEVAAIIGLSPKTVETYRSRLMKKLAVSDLPALVKLAVKHGLTPE